jgi:hypothetical protein
MFNSIGINFGKKSDINNRFKNLVPLNECPADLNMVSLCPYCGIKKNRQSTIGFNKNGSILYTNIIDTCGCGSEEMVNF